MGPAKFLSVTALMAGAATLGCTLSTPVTYSAINSPPRAFARRDPANVDVFVGKAPVRPSLDVGLFGVYHGAHSGTGPPTALLENTTLAVVAPARRAPRMRCGPDPGCRARGQDARARREGRLRDVHRRPGASGGEPDRCSEAAAG